MADVKNEFKNPGSSFKSAPFWSWNDKLEVKELCKQLDDMKAGGFGGSFMHSRAGLITPYLSQEWMNCIKDTVEYSKKTGLLAYLYDEDRWPSGFAGGITTRKKKNCIRAIAGKKTRSKWSFSKVVQPPQQWFNNTPYLATINKDAVKDFIASTYEAYKNAVGSEFGKTIPGIFTDEPDYLVPWFWPKGSTFMPWTGGFEDIFKKKYGYELSGKLELLVEEKDGFEKVRYDYWKLAAGLFLENFGKQIYEWCDKNHIPFTGHYANEDSFPEQIRSGAAMPLYEYMHIPGIDHLTRRLKFHILTIKQCSSVAHQLDKKRVLSEIYGASGQNFSFTERKQVGDWDIVLGINLFCPHLWLYSMRGCRKRDYPPTISYQQPYWKYNKALEDHFTRLNYMTSQGRFKPDLLIIHPIESAWIIYNPSRTEKCRDLSNKITDICEDILSNHYDFDFGDESLLEKYGKVEKTGSQVYLAVGNMKYPLVLLPQMLSIRKSTLALLEKFINEGGRVFAAGRLPSLLEGEKGAKELEMLKKIQVCPVKDVVKTIEGKIEREISVAGKDGKEIPQILCQKRSLDGGGAMYLLANTSTEKPFSTKVSIKGTGNPEYWDSFTGEMYSVPAGQKEGRITAEIFFPAAGSRLLVLNSAPAGLRQSDISMKEELPAGQLSGDWKFSRIDENSITLDMCRYKTGKKNKWSKPLPVISLQSGLERKNKRKKITVEYVFDADFGRKPGRLFLVLEQPEIYLIRINGRVIKYEDIGWWVDKSFKKMDIKDYIELKGRNTVELSCEFIPPKKHKTLIFVENGVELESVYLAGDFAVTGKFNKAKGGFAGEKFVLRDEKDKINDKDLVSGGYPFFSGSVKFSREFESVKQGAGRIFLKFEEFSAMCAKISVNGKEAGLVFLPPHELDITDCLQDGKNNIEIELTNTLRNLLGPHHWNEIKPWWTGPDQFEKIKGKWTDRYLFTSFGLGKVNLISKK